MTDDDAGGALMTIEEFIEARLAEDEDIAAGARRGPRRDSWAEDAPNPDKPAFTIE